MYHVGRPGEDGYAKRVLQAWGVDGHNSHTNVCSSSARLGHFLWCGNDRPSPDYANAKSILLLSSHLETGHYFNPHAQRIIEGKTSGATLIVIDPRLSNTAAKANLWLPTYPGTEGALLLAMVNVLLDEKLYDREFVRRWVNWEAICAPSARTSPSASTTSSRAEGAVRRVHAGVRRGGNRRAGGEDRRGGARDRPRARHASARTTGASAAAGNLGGWLIARCLYFSSCSPASSAPKGGVGPHLVEQVRPEAPNPPPPPDYWNELLFPREYPLAFFEMSFLLPHFLKEGRGKLDVYFTRVYNPVWTNPDGFSWMEVLRRRDTIGLHAALTPTWSETAWFADYVLPMGLGTERHDPMSQETHAGSGSAFASRCCASRARSAARPSTPRTRRIRARCGRRTSSGSSCRGASIPTERWASASTSSRRTVRARSDDRRVLRLDLRELGAGLPEAAAHEDLTPLEYMRKYGVFKVRGPRLHAVRDAARRRRCSRTPSIDPDDELGRSRTARRRRDGRRRAARRLPDAVAQARVLLADARRVGLAGARDAALRAGPRALARSRIATSGEFVLLPNFRLPTLVHTRSPVKWLNEISHDNPLWIATADAQRSASTPAIW